LFSKVDSNKLRGNVKNEIALICAKFSADLVSTFEVYKQSGPVFEPLHDMFTTKES